MANEQKRPRGVLIVAAAVIVFGLGEVWVGWKGNYLGILSSRLPTSAATAVVGMFYVLAGITLLTTRSRWGTVLGLVFIAAEVAGRAYLVLTGVAPHSGGDFFKIIVGGLIAVGFMLISACDRSEEPDAPRQASSVTRRCSSGFK